jgi:hypothetical protein
MQIRSRQRYSWIESSIRNRQAVIMPLLSSKNNHKAPLLLVLFPVKVRVLSDLTPCTAGIDCVIPEDREGVGARLRNAFQKLLE